MPRRLLFVRHGESEGNKTQDLPPEDVRAALVKDVPDNELRLTAEGVRQAQAAGKWLREYLATLRDPGDLAGFVSTFIRAKETAGNLGLGIGWDPHAFIIERDWGKFEELTGEERKRIKARKKRNPLYCTMPNGQSLSGLLLSNHAFFGKLHREHAKGTVIAVCHGERILTARYMLERMTDKGFGDLVRSRHTGDRVRNCQIVEYTRIDPVSGRKARSFGWMRSFCPWDLREKDLLWNAIVRKKMTDEDLLAYVGDYPRFLAA